MGGGERRNVNASLQVGSTNQTVEVTGTADVLAPVDSGEKSAVLTTEQLSNYVQVGSNAAEYLKIMPGFGNQNGANNKSSYTRPGYRHQRQRRWRKPESPQQWLLLQWSAGQHAGYRGRRGSCLRSRAATAQRL